jgi:hypothetical protein
MDSIHPWEPMNLWRFSKSSDPFMGRKKSHL